ncbi:hypothetical protein [Cryptosporangium minutisporangium]|uniref:Uncharacterized protein n=1 Tax=Cryptosporangium minutisporangium TaxID=113569 RepID=A0ABP6TD38_9ACTN
MAIAEELTAGVVSSVLAVLLVEIYLWLRRRYRQRTLRWLIGTDTAAIVTPVYPWAENSHPAGLLTTYDAIGLAHVLEACNRIGTVPVVSRSGESAENSPLDVIAIGGPSGNQVTATFLKAYCPGFEILTDPETGRLSYRCGGRVFERTEDETFAFIVRLSPKETGLPGTALIAWGHSAVSTATAGYYLARYSKSLRKVGKGSFFVAISVRWVLGYRSFDTRPIDLTSAAFAPPPEPPRSLPPAPPPEEEPTPRARRFGRARASGAPDSAPMAAGRSRVAEALDDVRAASVMTSGPSPSSSESALPSGASPSEFSSSRPVAGSEASRSGELSPSGDAGLSGEGTPSGTAAPSRKRSTAASRSAGGSRPAAAGSGADDPGEPSDSAEPNKPTKSK